MILNLISPQIFLLLLEYIDCADIRVQPVSINTTLNSTIVFSCEGTGDDLSFRVNNTPATNIDVIASGFRGATANNGGTRSAELRAIAYDYNNNTEVKCRAITDDPPEIVFSNTATLMIQGLLDSVVDLDYTFINGSNVLLTWTAPYTLDNVPITGYYVVNGSVNITTTNNTNFTSATNPDPCILNNVSVSPINDVGIGSSNNISFYFETVPLITPPVSVVPIIDRQLILNISINVSTICKGEYPNSVTVDILNTDDTVIHNTSISTQVNDQLMAVTGSTSSLLLFDIIDTFIVNVLLSNDGGSFNDMSSFTFGFLGPVTDIDSSIDNCSTINITWTAPTVDDGVSILYYNLSIYDAISVGLLDAVLVYDTSYQFVDNNLFIHCYTYVITGVNELGEGISNNDTFSYQRVPRSVTEASLSGITAYNETNVTASFNIPITLVCTGEAPEGVTIIIQCGTGFLLSATNLVKFAHMSVNITKSVSGIPIYKQCNISIVVSNDAGSSDAFILAFDTYPTITNVTTTVQTSSTAPNSTHTTVILVAAVSGVLLLACLIASIACIVHVYKRKLYCKNKVYTLVKQAEWDAVKEAVYKKYNLTKRFNWCQDDLIN